ncbi:MAG: 2-nitropropane dioxygenase [Betaproteobacteria bacterium RIFCSPLOWO2_02_FULL_63_19]|nr:MAG: 2-nitropropane dioxygenase [Betaproteobacteria bacterium RIFCSPLOWO2_02_FULL_63_19]
MPPRRSFCPPSSLRSAKLPPLSSAGSEYRTVAWWSPEGSSPIGDETEFRPAITNLTEPVLLIRKNGTVAAVRGGTLAFSPRSSTAESYPVAGFAPAVRPEDLGDGGFCADYRLRYAYVAGAMANGIASTRLVEEMGRAGMLGFFGAAGLSLERVEAAIEQLEGSMRDTPYGFNLIHSPNEPELEAAVADLYLRRGIRLVEASAYLRLTLPLVRYRVSGIGRDAQGRVVAPNRIIAKASRVEVASQFFSPPSEEFLTELVGAREITQEQAVLAAALPIAQDLTAEADSGGHTDNRPLVTLLPTMLALRDRMQRERGYALPLRVGAAGGLSTPAALAAAYSMGAAYVLTGSVNQACTESGSSDAVRSMLARAEQADIAMAPAADMFEMGVRVQVLKRGTMFPMRAARLYDLYRAHAGLEDLSEADRTFVEKQLLRTGIEEAWRSTRAYFLKRDPEQVERAESDPKHRMALVFRSYLGLSSRWANDGDPSRVVDYQVWCGPAMGAFNEWTRGSFLEKPENRRVAVVGHNLLFGAAMQLRWQHLRSQGIQLPMEAVTGYPLEPEALRKALNT